VDPIPAETEAIAKEIIDAALKVHRALGPGLLESVCEACLIHELRRRGLTVQSQVPVNIEYEGLKIDGGLRLDLLVGGVVVVEVKTVEALLPVHEAQLLS